MITNYPPQNAQEARSQIAFLLKELESAEQSIIKAIGRGNRELARIRKDKVHYSQLLREKGIDQ